ncbi:MAG: galactose oxidase-like domain-containing protein [candidate division Zixibacteria bacterium]|nr:galactose oxidase-like domain-containing protein [candidate division Zixibacteria bacterium]
MPNQSSSRFSRFSTRLPILAASATILLFFFFSGKTNSEPVTAEHQLTVSVSGMVLDSANASAPLPNVRVMIFDSLLSVFQETRTNNFGMYSLNNLPTEQLIIGFAAPNYGYKQSALTLVGQNIIVNVNLLPETEPGRWSIVGSSAPEYLDASNSGSLLPNGTILFCHDTKEPILFDPATGISTIADSSSSEQGCHISTLLLNGDLVFIGGQGSEDFTDAVKTTKVYDYRTNTWTNKQDMFEERWYPALSRLHDGKLLIMGGGQTPDAARTKTCEIYNPETNSYTYTDSMLNSAEFTPSLLMLNGEVLRTWYPPQIYSPMTGTWRTTGQLVQQNRFWPGHSDHSIILLPDGRPMICGIYRGNLTNPSMVEFFDPITETWNLGPTPQVTRSQPEIVLLPNGKVLCAAGRLEDNNHAIETDKGYTKLSDIYDPPTNSWRSVAKLLTFHEYHATTLLVPDGRVITAGGSNLNFTGPTNYNIEAYEPPYLFRGPRPVITSISSTDLNRSLSFTLNVSRADSVTQVILTGTGSVTHWVDGGIPRYISLPFEQDAQQLSTTVPGDSNTTPLGYYMLFVLVDDVPSEGRIVRIGADTACCIGSTGNLDGDIGDTVDISDLTMMIDRLFISLAPLSCPAEANTDGTGNIDVSDLTALIDFLFISLQPLPTCQ